MTSAQRSPELHIIEACEQDLIAYGDTHLGAGYTRTAAAARAQYAMMLDVVREDGEITSILDLGCGLAHLLDYINSRPEMAHLRYTGLELSQKYLAAARKRHPGVDCSRRLREYDDVDRAPPDLEDALEQHIALGRHGVVSGRSSLPSAWTSASRPLP